MAPGSEQIVTAFEQLGLSPAEIAQEQELDELSVKACLMQFSSKFRSLAKKESNSAVAIPDDIKVGFTDHQEEMAIATIADLAAYSDNEQVKLKAAIFIRDDRQGRLDFASKMGSLNINVITFNDQLKRAVQAVERAKAPEFLNVETEVTAEVE